MTDFEQALDSVVRRAIAGVNGAVTVRRLSAGASQETYAVEFATDDGPCRLALRRTPGGGDGETDYGRIGPATEARLMTLARESGVPEPRVRYVLTPADGLGEGFLMDWIAGETLGARIARHADFATVRPRLAYQCGEILARIHAIDIVSNRLDQDLPTLDPEAFIHSQWQLYQNFATPQPMIDYTARWLLQHRPSQGTALTLVHNDFRNGNLIVDPQHGVVAVLDWEVAHIGDPMRDLGWICTNSWRFGVTEREVGGFGDLDDLLAGYASVSGVQIDREVVRYWQVFGSFWWAIGCLVMHAHYRDGTERSVERPAIGRRSSECQIDCVNLLMPGAVTLPAALEVDDEQMPRSEELLTSVRDFLREEVTAETSGRTGFLARVAANSLDILVRERTHAPAQRAAEHTRLVALLGHSGPLETLRWKLVERLRDGSLDLEAPDLTRHLRETVVGQVAIDQPRYSGLQVALANAGRARA